MIGNGVSETPTGFELSIPADPTWEPMEFSDVLDKDGCFHGVITAEKATALGAKNGIFLTIALQDDDVASRKLNKFLQDPRQNEKVWFLWRGLMRSVTGSTEGARQGFAYRPGAFNGQHVYFKVESYLNNDGERQSGVGTWMTKTEYDAAVAAGKHRWEPSVRGGSKAGNAALGGLPTGLAGFPVPAAPTAGQQAAQPPAPPSAPPAAPPAPTASPFAFPGIKK